MWYGLCEQNRIVQPLRRNCSIRSTHFFWKCWSPTASASSMISRSGSTAVTSANASRTVMPDE